MKKKLQNTKYKLQTNYKIQITNYKINVVFEFNQKLLRCTGGPGGRFSRKKPPGGNINRCSNEKQF
jgi:hypothetical protein